MGYNAMDDLLALRYICWPTERVSRYCYVSFNITIRKIDSEERGHVRGPLGWGREAISGVTLTGNLPM
jgi:hypothetical protein